jgi:hypothetical protein
MPALSERLAHANRVRPNSRIANIESIRRFEQVLDELSCVFGEEVLGQVADSAMAETAPCDCLACESEDGKGCWGEHVFVYTARAIVRWKGWMRLLLVMSIYSRCEVGWRLGVWDLAADACMRSPYVHAGMHHIADLSGCNYRLPSCGFGGLTAVRVSFSKLGCTRIGVFCCILSSSCRDGWLSTSVHAKVQRCLMYYQRPSCV